MELARIVVLLAGVASTLLFPLFVGHALSTHEMGPVVWGTVGLVAGAILILVSTRIGRPGAAGSAGH